MKKALKRSLSLLLAITIIFGSMYVGLSEVDFGGLFVVKAKAASSGTCGYNLTWTLDDEGTLTISGTGDMTDYSSSSSVPWDSSRENIKTVVIDNSVTSIGEWAFGWCKSLTSIKIPDSVTSIGDEAFSCCYNLTSIIIPDGVTSIGGIAFSWCTSLTSITVASANEYYSSINGVLFNKDKTEIICYPKGKIGTSYTIPDSVTSIGEYAFSTCTSLTSITIPDSVTSIGEHAFSVCTSLTSVTIPDSVTSIGEHAFSSCESLTSIEIPDSVTSIGACGFSGCTNLTSVTIGKGVTSIGYEAFHQCTNLATIIIPDSVVTICPAAFECCSSLTSITIPDGVTSIGSLAFSWCTSLTSITIPDSVTSIGNSVFYYCTSLKHVYYQGTKEQWKNISIRNGNDYLTSAIIHYDSDKKGGFTTKITDSDGIWFNLRNKQAFAEGEVNGLVSGESNIAVSGGSASYNGTTKTLPTDSFFISRDDLNTGIIVTAPDYNTYIIPSAVVDSWKNDSPDTFSVYMSQDTKDGETYISSVFARNCGGDEAKEYIDITTENLKLLNGVNTDVIITAVEQGSPIVEYWLSQDEAHKIPDADGTFSATDLYSIFDENKPIYAYAVLENGKTTEPVSVSLEKKVMSNTAATFLNACDSSTVSLMGADGFKITLSDEIPLVGGANISTGLSMFPIGVEIQNERVRISLGIDIFKNEINGKSDTEWFNFKESCKMINKAVDGATDKMKTYRTLMTAKGFGTVETEPLEKKNFDGSFLGYIEAYIVDGEIVFKEVSGTVALEFFFNYKQQFLVAGIPAIYAYVKAGAEASVDVSSGRAVPDKNLPFEFDVALNLTPSVKIGGGVGIKDAISAGIWGKGSMPVGYNFTDTHFTMGLKGEIGLEAEFFMLKGDVTLLDGSLNLIDHYFNSSKEPLSGQSDAMFSGNTVDVFEDGEVSLADRSYLENTSVWLGGQSASTYRLRRTITPESVTISDLQTSVYKNSQTQLVQFGDTMLMAWIEDCADRDAYNRMRLVYSVYDTTTGLWGEPQAVADNGTCDAAPSLATDGENVYIAWQNIDYTVSTADSETVDILMENAEIRLAKYNAETGFFEDVITVTDNATYDYAPKVVVNNGVAEVYWVNSSSADFSAGTLSILKSDFSGTTETVLSALNYIHGVDSNGTDVSYTMDKDGDTSTTTDIKVYTNSEQVSFDYENVETSCLYATYAMLDGEKTLFYVDDYNLCYIQNGEEKVVFESPRCINGNLQICSDGTKTTAMWLEAGEIGTEIYTCNYENGEWTAPVQLTSFSKVLSNVALTYFNGKIYGVFNRTNLEEVTSEVDGSTYFKNGDTDLCQLTTEGFTDVYLSLLEVDESQFICGEDAIFTVLVNNNGTEKITDISFEITDGNGYAQTIEKTVDLASGASEFVELTYTVPETIAETTLSVYASVANDANEEDNTISESIGTADLSISDLSVKFVENVYIVSGIVSNNNNVAAEDVYLNAYLGDVVDENLFASNIGTIEPHGTHLVEFMVDASLMDFSENSNYDVTLNINSSGAERVDYNNEAVTVIMETGIHFHTYGDWVIEKEVTCTENGSKYKECTSCGKKIVELSIATGHSFSDEWTIDVAPTCTEEGSKSHHCIGCDDKTDVTTIEATGHSYSDEWTIDVAPTCTEEGSKSHHCTVCGDKTDVTIVEATGHNNSMEWVIDVAPTCTEEGSKSHHCTVCGDKTDVTTVEPTGHSYADEWIIDVAPTCTEEGSKSHHCTVCGDKTDVTIVEATGHNYVKINISTIHPHTITHKCFYCQDVKTETTVSSSCIECNFNITIEDTNTYKLVSYIGSETEVIIPATYNDLAVTTIANSCFRNNKTITSVKIADGVTSIGSIVFMNCTSLKKVVIPASVTSIGAQAFYGFTGTIYCLTGSYAHNYAISNNIKYVAVSVLETEDCQIDYERFIIQTTEQQCNDITAILDFSETAVVSPTASYTYGDLELYGTGTGIAISEGDNYIGKFTLVVEGDTNGDSVCDALDALRVALIANDRLFLYGAYAMAADSNSDDVIDVTDYQSIVNKAVS